MCDASVAIAGVAEDEQAPECAALLERAILQGAAAPAIWALEVANILGLKLQRKKISAEGRRRALASLRSVDIALDVVEFRSAAFDRTIGFADEHRLTLYDAAYLELAVRLGCPLATLDSALREAARAENIALLPA